jgi:hypothetical protein
MSSLQKISRQSPIQQRGSYYLCKLGRSILPIPRKMFKGFEQSLLATSEQREYERLLELTRVPQSPMTPSFSRDESELVQLEQQLCEKINCYFVEKPEARKAIQDLHGEALNDGFEMAIEAIQWLADAYELRVVDAAGFAPGVTLVTRVKGERTSREGLVIPSNNLSVIRFLDDRITFRYRDLRSLHILTDTGAWEFYPPLHVSTSDNEEQGMGGC